MILLGSLFFGGCNYYCNKIDERICNDLGPDCSVWRSDARLRSMIIPENLGGRRPGRARENTCSALADDAIYSSRTLPIVRNYIARLRNPNAPQVPVPMGAPPVSGSSYLSYLIMPLALLGMFGYVGYHRKFVMPKVAASHEAHAQAAAQAQARAMAEWQAQQSANSQSNPHDGGFGGGPSA